MTTATLKKADLIAEVARLESLVKRMQNVAAGTYKAWGDTWVAVGEAIDVSGHPAENAIRDTVSNQWDIADEFSGWVFFEFDTDAHPSLSRYGFVLVDYNRQDGTWSRKFCPAVKV